jgi:hypothetical protein
MKNFHIVKATWLGWDSTTTFMRVSLYSPLFKSRKTIACEQDETTTDAAVRYLRSIGFDIEGTDRDFSGDFDLIVCNTFEPIS